MEKIFFPQNVTLETPFFNPLRSAGSRPGRLPSFLRSAGSRPGRLPSPLRSAGSRPGRLPSPLRSAGSRPGRLPKGGSPTVTVTKYKKTSAEKSFRNVLLKPSPVERYNISNGLRA